jgi:hypothetical protein
MSWCTGKVAAVGDVATPIPEAMWDYLVLSADGSSPPRSSLAARWRWPEEEVAALVGFITQGHVPERPEYAVGDRFTTQGSRGKGWEIREIGLTHIVLSQGDRSEFTMGRLSFDRWVTLGVRIPRANTQERDDAHTTE